MGSAAGAVCLYEILFINRRGARFEQPVTLAVHSRKLIQLESAAPCAQDIPCNGIGSMSARLQWRTLLVYKADIATRQCFHFRTSKFVTTSSILPVAGATHRSGIKRISVAHAQ